ncbi:hypothetical protein [Cytobacillus purgationiresistens]|uniref:Uncharacterized protein n=1 Tax=Cytobacillus purgationiresistens TaxID=863449 RepID=A0ABU0AV93_9BACI|nr:hypothetical protein [Cytobacillus purgationiresistens]MDQ0273905.1 hypothetical protein [Cytobacillus purgationiresistens]
MNLIYENALYIDYNCIDVVFGSIQGYAQPEEEDYFGVAKTFCGKEIAEKLWLVRLNFPKAPGANLAKVRYF